MKVVVDHSRCDGNGKCVEICPEIFQFAPGSKKAMVVMDPVPESYYGLISHAVQNCPRRAIRIEDTKLPPYKQE